MNHICKICNQEVIERSHFWRNHKTKEKDYYEKYVQKKDLLTQEKIEFKNPEQYELQDFKEKNNLKKYLENNTQENNLNYLSDWLMRRNKTKNYLLAPGQFEIKSLFFPSIKYLNKKFGPKFFSSICSKSKLDNRYDYNNDTVIFDEKRTGTIFCDTREQHLLSFDDMEVQKLDYGDYNLNGSRVFIERKSLTDFIGTLSKGFERFQKELERCFKNNDYIVVLIEEKYSNLLSFNYLPHCKRIEATPDFIMHRARELINQYPRNLQMLAVDGRAEAKRVIERIFKIDNIVDIVDLQYFYDSGVL